MIMTAVVMMMMMMIMMKMIMIECPSIYLSISSY